MPFALAKATAADLAVLPPPRRKRLACAAYGSITRSIIFVKPSRVTIKIILCFPNPFPIAKADKIKLIIIAKLIFTTHD
ncbi:MAG: hypothetical protein BGP14_07195 [Sphingobacteriales bacterium 44-15]|nr:MAG: hypothetical protein BGP14_07195 [Sphingobacteriales bacterium 44-15]